MKYNLVTLAIGIGAGLIDAVPMAIRKMNKRYVVSAFFQYFFVSIVILNIEIPVLTWWLKGGIVSFALAIPIAILVSENDKKAVPVIMVTSIVLGTLIGIAGNFFY